MYNDPFTIEELQRAINMSTDNSQGPDEVSNMLLKAVPETAFPYILRVSNVVWKRIFFYNKWRVATIIPIPKPGKDHSNPRNFRPISLTSCLCKILEKMINGRLVEYMENKIFNEIQCGFRRYKLTVDHLLRMVTFVRKGFACYEMMYIFFNMEKAYDKTWRYGIMRDFHSTGLRGRLPLIINQILHNCMFQVKLQGCYLNTRIQESGVARGLTISVSLFAIKINSFSKVIQKEIHVSMFVDSVQISYSHRDINELQRILQRGVDSIAEWARNNGFTFST